MSHAPKGRRRRAFQFGCLGCAALTCLLGAGLLVLANTDGGRLASKDFYCYQLEDARECNAAGTMHDLDGNYDEAERYYRRACELYYDAGCMGLMSLATTHHLAHRNERAIQLAVEACANRVDSACPYARRWRAESER